MNQEQVERDCYQSILDSDTVWTRYQIPGWDGPAIGTKMMTMYADSIRNRLSRFGVIKHSDKHWRVYCDISYVNIVIYLYVWQVVLSHGNMGKTTNVVGVTRGKFLRRLDMIIDYHSSICDAIADLLPQPIAEEIAPQICVVDRLVSMFE